MLMHDRFQAEVYDEPDPRRVAAEIDQARWEAFIYEVRQFAADHGWANVDRAVGQAKAEDRQRG